MRHVHRSEGLYIYIYIEREGKGKNSYPIYKACTQAIVCAGISDATTCLCLFGSGGVVRSDSDQGSACGRREWEEARKQALHVLFPLPIEGLISIASSGYSSLSLP